MKSLVFDSTEWINISDILESNGDQTVTDAIEDVEKGIIAKHYHDPIVVTETPTTGHFLINDGFHRVAEHILNGDRQIEADIYILE